eukprot:COSAG05_NODE_8328_length_713_cov_345.068404_2_plen_99_part_00
MRGFAEAQQVTAKVEDQQSPRDKLLAMIGGGKQDVATLKQELAAKDKELAAKDEAHHKELAAKDEAHHKELAAHQEEIAKFKAQLQKLQPPEEGVPPV